MDHHRAYDTTLLIPGLDKVESFVAWEDFLLVSLTNRDLIKFQITGNHQKSKFQVKQIELKTKFTKKPITQMEIIKPIKKLLVRQGTAVEIYDLKTIQLEKALCSKKAVLFTYNKKKSLCIGTKSELWIFKWENGSFNKKHEIGLPDIPKTIDWFKANKIVIGLKKQYLLISLPNKTPVRLFSTGKNGIPISAKISNDEILLGKDKISIFKDSNGKAPRAYGINWEEPPLKIRYFPPYVIGFFLNKLRVRTLYSQNFVQDIKIKNPKLCFTLVNADNHNFGYVSNKKGVWRIDEIPLLFQIDMLSFEKNFEEALRLCELIPNLDQTKKNSKSKDIKQHYAIYLFSKRNFGRAMDFFQQSNCDPRVVLSLYPFLVSDKFDTQLKIPYFEQTELNNDEKQEAIFSLIEYLTQQRSIIQNRTFEDQENLLKVIDNTIVKAYIQTNYQLVKHFLKLPNSCDLEECEKLLQENGFDDEVIFLYQSKGKHAKALKTISKKANETSNIDELFEYLKILDENDLDLIFKYAHDIYKYDSLKCFNIFLNDNELQKNVKVNKKKKKKIRNLPRDKVKNFLEKNIPDLLIPYLEYIIYEYKDNTPDFNNHLLMLYFQQYGKLKTQIQNETDKGNLKRFVETQNEIKMKMNQFIKLTNDYQAEKMLSIFPEDDLFEERAIFLNRVKQHELALDIYINKLNNIESAEKYCTENYQSDGDTKDIYIIFLHQLILQLNKKNNNNSSIIINKDENNFNENEDQLLKMQLIINLMKKYYLKIDPLKIIPIIPKEFPISNLFDYFNLIIKNILKIKRRTVIQKNLHKSDFLNLSFKNSKKGSKSLMIDENTLCQVCGKRIGNSIIGKYPNGVVAHLSCIENKNICPKTKMDFSKNLNKYY
ncbi:cnh domain containing [Anaeramoeba flamelloides]|uniref:Cnh domain containing n=1 Tax=Anaeramoeba flamelloides TaxID=1746091 RepID=A0AAV7ZUJ4_9EUKA|nr:cnh domain containing [Anaeramoeba flamelloides]